MYSKCDFWTSHAKKLACTKLQLDRSFRSEFIKEDVYSKWWILVPIRYFAQISNSEISGTTKSLEIKFSEFSYFSDTYKWCKNEETLRGNGVLPWMIWYRIAQEEYPKVKIGRSKFTSLRPADVLLSSKIPRNVCLCMYHKNVVIALEVLHKAVPTIPAYSLW